MSGVESSPAVEDGAGWADVDAKTGAAADDFGIDTGIVIRDGGTNGVGTGAGTLGW